MFDFHSWCRLCGSLESFLLLDTEVVNFIEKSFEIPMRYLRICKQCNMQLSVTIDLIRKAKNLERLFQGLEEETDLSVPRLNAYRSHFHLKTKIIETNVHPKVEQTFECVYKEEIGDVHELQEELIEDEELIDYDASGCEEVYINEDGDEFLELAEKSPKRRFGFNLEKTDEEKLFTFQCHLCHEPEYNKMKDLTIHCKSEHDCLPRVKCCSESCETLLSTWRRLLIHKDKHFPKDSQLRCNECQKVYQNLQNFEKHIQSHQIRFICSQCGKEFKEAKTLRSHEATHDRPLEERRIFSCLDSKCDMRFITKQAMQNHWGQKHQRIISFVCQEPGCDRNTKGFYTRKGYLEHMRIHGERKFFCEMCNFKAKTKSALNTHIETHKVGEAFSCDICNAGFTLYRRLKAHMVCHSEVTPFQCSYCDSAFKRRKDWKDHLNVHTKERPFNCLFCPRDFSNAANRRKHCLKDHATELQTWEMKNGVGGRMKLKCYQ